MAAARVVAGDTVTPFLARLERLRRTDSTQRVVHDWLAQGIPEVCVATADEQLDGRGRQGRAWTAPAGAALLLSCGFRPTWLKARHAWRLGAIVALAMVDAAEDAAGLRDGALALKWPNDIVVDAPDGGLRKVAGVLGEGILADDRVASAVIGIGVNADWPAETFPAPLAASMSSLREASGGRPIDREALLEGWLARLEPRYEALRDGVFDAGGWTARQRTTGRRVEVDTGAGTITGRGAGVDPESGALLVEPAGEASPVAVGSGEVLRCRILELPRLSVLEGL
jgi:BirA family biotin operon repressor/biotin-[acetyl-CoA-carboxylase] ligase